MAVLLLFLSHHLIYVLFTIILIIQHSSYAYTGSRFILDTEYSGSNFFDGWDFFTGDDPTGGFVTYYSRSSSHLKGLINSSDTDPAYIGVDSVNVLPITPAGRADGAGRPSVRITTQRSWTHGLFIGDMNHAPSGICGTWPAFWTLGPNWPFTGEVDIMEGVNKIASNAVALHTKETCSINSNHSTQLGTLSNDDCAYYPGYNVGCGVVDPRPASYSDFNKVGGGVYAMLWTSESIRVWFFPRNAVPQDISNKTPNPSSWGLPAANMMGNCEIDRHFQQHRIVFDTTFCGEYAGSANIWNAEVNSCALDTGYATCDSYVAKNPAAFREAYWSINYVRVYQLVDPARPVLEPQYIASMQPAISLGASPNPSTPAPSPTTSLCPKYNFTTIQNGKLVYEIECNYDLPGPDLPPPYSQFKVSSFEDCVAGCTYYNTINGTNLCGGVAYDASIPFCYFKKYINSMPMYRLGFAGARLIYYGYPQITDDPRLQPVLPTSTFVEILPTPQIYRPLITSSATTSTLPTSIGTTYVSLPTVAPPPLGDFTTTTTGATSNDTVPTVSFSGTVSIPISNSTLATTSGIASVTSSKATLITIEKSPTQGVVSSPATILQPTGLSGIFYNATNVHNTNITTITKTWYEYCPTCPDHRMTLAATITVSCTKARSEIGFPLQTPISPIMTSKKECSCRKDGVVSATTVENSGENHNTELTSAAPAVITRHFPAALTSTVIIVYDDSSILPSNPSINPPQIVQQTGDSTRGIVSTIAAVQVANANQTNTTFTTTPSTLSPGLPAATVTRMPLPAVWKGNAHRPAISRIGFVGSTVLLFAFSMIAVHN